MGGGYCMTNMCVIEYCGCNGKNVLIVLLLKLICCQSYFNRNKLIISRKMTRINHSLLAITTINI